MKNLVWMGCLYSYMIFLLIFYQHIGCLLQKVNYSDPLQGNVSQENVLNFWKQTNKQSRQKSSQHWILTFNLFWYRDIISSRVVHWIHNYQYNNYDNCLFVYYMYVDVTLVLIKAWDPNQTVVHEVPLTAICRIESNSMPVNYSKLHEFLSC